jgi:hypothetical protein
MARGQPHDEIAKATKHGGYGGLYYLVAGEHRAGGVLPA